MTNSRRLRVLTWHVHGAYLYYLSHVPHDFYAPVREGRPEGYGGRAGTLPWPDNLHEIPAEAVRNEHFDCILFQSRRNYEIDQHEILTENQRRLPRIYLEHDPPQQVPTDTRHLVDDPDVLLVHVTHFNNLMWDSGSTPTRVIEHGVKVPGDIHYTGEKDRGITVVNNLNRRGRRLGLDVFLQAREEVALDLYGMASDQLGGKGDLPSHELFRVQAQYRYHFSPIRYTSLGLAICEAMMLGLPVVGLATTELATVIENGRSGYVHTDVRRLIHAMQELERDRDEARRLGEGARRVAVERFGMHRFIEDWSRALADVTETKPMAAASSHLAPLRNA